MPRIAASALPLVKANCLIVCASTRCVYVSASLSAKSNVNAAAAAAPAAVQPLPLLFLIFQPLSVFTLFPTQSQLYARTKYLFYARARAYACAWACLTNDRAGEVAICSRGHVFGVTAPRSLGVPININLMAVLHRTAPSAPTACARAPAAKAKQ